MYIFFLTHEFLSGTRYEMRNRRHKFTMEVGTNAAPHPSTLLNKHLAATVHGYSRTQAVVKIKRSTSTDGKLWTPLDRLE